MILRLLCPSGHVLDVDAQLAGRKIRCGACGKIMVVPGPARKPPASPIAKPTAKPPAGAATGPIASPPVGSFDPAPPAAEDTALVPHPFATPPVGSLNAEPEQPLIGSTTDGMAPPAEPIVGPPPAVWQPPPPQPKKPTVEPPRTTAADLPREPDVVALPLPPSLTLPPALTAGENAAPLSDNVAVYRTAALAFSSWLRARWPAAERNIPPDATIPGRAERRVALQLAGVLSAAALLSLLPVIAKGHANLFVAPHWALALVFLAVLQWVYAGWMINAPDWATARVQMALCAVVTTIYGMFMTLAMITPAKHGLVLGLDEVRRAAPAWCGLMFLVMGCATWFCGRTSAKWRGRLSAEE